VTNYWTANRGGDARLFIKHITAYKHRQPVALGDHRRRLRPLDSHDQSLMTATLVITPTLINIRRTHHAFGNHVDIGRFAARAKELPFESNVCLDHSHTDINDLDIDEIARSGPFM
jgi:hypothetical protein